MRPVIFLPFLILALGCNSQNPVSQVARSQKISFEDTKATACDKDDDCTLISETCCGCNQGGRRLAVNKEFAKTILVQRSEECGSTLCMQVISTHKSCTEWTQAVCEQNRCKGR